MPSAEQVRIEALLKRVSDRLGPALTHVHVIPPAAGATAPWPAWVPADLVEALGRRGIAAPWRHQVAAAEAAWAGENVIISTGTASGKSLAYLLPVLSRLRQEPARTSPTGSHHGQRQLAIPAQPGSPLDHGRLAGATRRPTALYVSPTKALGADQLRSILDLNLVLASDYDGDTPQSAREWIRSNARLILTNPDMLHYSILPGHQRWRPFLSRLSFVVVDECHTYRGIFGSHVAAVLRRLRRIVVRYAGAEPVFILASATVSEPAMTARRLIGLPAVPVTDDASPRAGITFGLIEPPLLAQPTAEAAGQRGLTAPTGPEPARGAQPTAEATSQSNGEPLGHDEPWQDGEPIRKSALTQTAELLAEAVESGVRSLAFVKSRRGAEVVAAAARRLLPEQAERIAAYRAGYLREERRELEQALTEGRLLGVAATNALELGVDISGLDLVLLAGYPGTLASMWQQAGRAGRADSPALCLLVARDDPLDTYLVHHPQSLFGRPIEASVLDPTNPYVLAPQLRCAATEAPLTVMDIELFGGEAAAAIVADLVAEGALRPRPTGWFPTSTQPPDVSLRGTGDDPIALVEADTGRLLGTVDAGAAHSQVHPGAVYVHQGKSFLVDRLDLGDSCAFMHAVEPGWSTHPRDTVSLDVVNISSYVDAGPVGLFLGEVDVTSQVVNFQRRSLASRAILATVPLDLPPRTLRTVAVWWTISAAALNRAGVYRERVPGALHAAEHAAIGLLPLVASCDRWDIGGLSTPAHADTAAPTVFVYDGHPGGAGFAERAYHEAARWLSATATAISDCACRAGCPSCVQSPKCGNGNSPLDKAGAVAVLAAVLANIPGVASEPLLR